MTTFSKLKLSGSTDGKQIKVVPTATAGTLIHTAHASALDEIWLWVDSSHNASVLLTIEYGGVTDPDTIIELNVPALGTASTDGLKLIVPGLLLTNSLVVRAFASVANVLKISGFVNRIA
ncbi:MAG: hypothetical protein A2Y53_05630 [Chloroflexi bacterium RBG_16_47_49]|nr:MAG: hypothetical protein A2Y53_05630 [Chloroflexi bacterium RBG_16_47_49]